MAHAVRLRADQQRHAAIVLEADLGALVRRAARGFHEAGHADAAQPATLLATVAAARRNPAWSAATIAIVEIGGEAAAVDHGAKRLAIGKLAHQVAPAQFDRIEPAAPRGLVDQALDHVVHFRLAGAAIGVDRHGVGEHAVHVHEDRRNDIAAAHRIRRRVGGAARPAGRQIGAEIGHRRDVQRQEASVRIQRQPRARDVVAALRGGDEILGALAHPLHRPAECARRPQQHHPFGIQRVLHAEAAADIRTGDVHPLGRHAEHAVGELRLQRMHAGAGEQQMEAVVIMPADRAARFQRARSRSGC